ncbi:MAG: tetratricopeptide repeat protein [Saprospiraceae bacterium]|nr:tetratricopeptide repeat protein [Saprospiraceae bacterium]MCF8251576.1 tetratricopeptide repeat protein [Saprospiraceae bacterium]MCF8282823.1 tetratricopeptide repeat protein [Bacteroidales bacterium]MCF8313471.1 tetratricopeptide repeat protein [Saprospiraceae bacterium]MCF8442212.1 tetratricopeptide repeat protein [Saprospiraceae bacterium]
MKSKNYSILLAALSVLLLFSACGNESKTPESAEPTVMGGTPQIQDISKKIGESPTNASLYATRGALWYENENYDEGIADLEKAIQIDSTKPEYYHVLADIYMDYYKSRQGLAVMEKAGLRFPDRTPTLLKLAEFQLIVKQDIQALATLQRIQQREPLNPEMFYMFGNVFSDMGKTDQAITAYQSAVENNPKLVDAWVKLANLLADKDSPAAGKYYDNAIKADSTDVSALHAKAYYLSNKKNDLKGAIELYKKINVVDPQYAEGYYNVGLIYLDMDSVKQAYKSFDLAVKVSPEFAEAYYHRGLAAEMKGDKVQALSDYENVLRFSPDFAGAKEGVKRLK